jgi:PTH1 family peptidyl-tRNA hydrolase
MKIAAGLGNIGEKYEKTRHNAGFMVIDSFVDELKKNGADINWKEDKKLGALIIKITYKSIPVLLIKPTTFMNLSGEAISKILNFFKETPENLIVIYDDIDLPLGNIRVRKEGSAGTHNGMRSIIQNLQTEKIPRIRIGTESRGTLSPQEQDLHSFVLTKFNKEEQQLIGEAVKEAVKELKKLISA